MSEAEMRMRDDDVHAIDELRSAYERMSTELHKRIVGQVAVIEDLLICVLSGGHALLMGVPGLAKTLLVHSLGDVLHLSFNRIQFTPDLMPSDITGTDILQESDVPGRRLFEFAKGPIFAHIVLADEINRTPPKTQAALLEAMQEHRVNAGGRTFELPKPFFVLATQNPIEQEGTYPLPEAQLDRFMFLITVPYPTYEDEVRIARETTGTMEGALEPVLGADQILKYQQLVRRVPVPEHLYKYVVALVRASRPSLDESPDWVRGWVAWGAGPRAVQNIILGAKARAILRGAYLVQKEDISHVATPVLRHRIITNFHAESEGISSTDIVRRLLEEIRS